MTAGNGRSYSAISVINGIPCGIGSTIGTNLMTEAVYEEKGSQQKVEIVDRPTMSDELVRTCVRRTLKYFNLDIEIPYELRIESQIPPSRGLKSSSSVCNAVIESVCDFHGVRMDPMDVILLGVGCAKEAKVTVTGAFDDSCGCHLGGHVITDNTTNKLLRRTEVPRHDVVLCIPEQTIPKSKVPVEKYRARFSEFKSLVGLAETDPFRALTLNGGLVADVIGMDLGIVEKALSLGAVAAGVSGTGPAIAVIVEEGEGVRFSEEMGCETIVTTTR